jgi:hypothetical protein
MFVAGRFINHIVRQISYDKDRPSTSSGFYILLEACSIIPLLVLCYVPKAVLPGQTPL